MTTRSDQALVREANELRKAGELPLGGVMKGRVSKDQLQQVVDGANKLVDELRANNEEFERNSGKAKVVDDSDYDELRFELLWTFLKRGCS